MVSDVLIYHKAVQVVTNQQRVEAASHHDRKLGFDAIKGQQILAGDRRMAVGAKVDFLGKCKRG